MTYAPTTEEVFTYHKATGCPVSRAKELLETMEPLLRERILRAVKLNRSLLLRDPIEQDPETAALVTQARNDAEEIVHSRGVSGKGTCHVIWREQERILREKYGLTWFSPQKMNPGAFFD